MPYIKQQDRLLLDDEGYSSDTVGELNYALTRLVLNYLHRGVPGYSDYNEVIGVLECAKLELYRRMVAPYEDKKCNENGDVYP